MKKFLTLTVLLAYSTLANADLINTSGSFGLTSTNWTHSINASQFDPALGELHSAKFTFSYYVEQQFKAENMGATADVLAPEAQSIFLMRKLFSTLNSSTLNGTVSAFSATAYDGTADFTGASGYDFGNTISTLTSTFTLTGLDLADLIGTGTLGSVGYDVRSIALGKITSDNGNLFSSIKTQSKYDLKVDYYYNSVPEPSTIALAAVALLLIRRK